MEASRSLRSSLFALILVAAAPATATATPPRSFSVVVQGKGSPVILIPGLACSGAVWDATVARYRDRHQLHVLTLAGFGGQKAIDGTLLPAVRSELAAYIKDHKLTRPVIVGHSLGGFLALWLAATEPSLVGKVVVVDALPFLAGAEDAKATVETMTPQAQRLRDMMLKASPEQFAAQNRAAVLSMVTSPKNAEPIAEMGRKSDQAAVTTAMYELLTTDLRPLLPKVTAPALVLEADAGPEMDQAFTAQYASLRGVQLKHAAGSRHFIFVDDPAFFFAALDGVLP